MQYVPYKSIQDQFVRDLTDIIKTEMIVMALKPVGKFIVPIWIDHSFFGFRVRDVSSVKTWDCQEWNNSHISNKMCV